MTDEVTLIAVVAVLYLSECVVVLRYGSLLVRAGGWRRGGAVVHPSALWGNEKGGLVWLNPFPPFGSAFVCHQWPLTITRELACSYVGQSINFRRRRQQDAVLIRAEHVRDVRQSAAAIHVAGARFASLVDERQARRFALILGQWAALPATDRDAAIAAWVQSAADERAAGALVEEYHRCTSGLRPLCYVLFVLLMIVLPLAAWLGRFLQVVPWLLAIGVPCWISVLWTFGRAHARLLPQRRTERRRALAKMVFMPVASIRACDAITRDLLSAFDPLAVAAAVCDRRTLESFARDVVLDLRYPLLPVCPSGSSELGRAEQSFRRQLQGELEMLLRRCGLDPECLAAPPVPDAPSHWAYCPRCRAQYLVASGECAECGGRPLVVFTMADAAPTPDDARMASDDWRRTTLGDPGCVSAASNE
jgi:hypothetical protein